MTRILIADDQKEICDILNDYARHEGYETAIARDGMETLNLFSSFQPDLVLLDVAMPEIDGFEVCREIRRVSEVPVFLITARTEEDDRVEGLDLGADDYITKPFSAREVMARIRGALRRMHHSPAKIELNGLEIDESHNAVTLNGHPLVCTRKEIQLLLVFANNPNLVLSRSQLLDKVWGYDSEVTDRAIDTQIKRLRRKMDAIEHPGLNLKTIWGVGYQLEADE